MFFRTAERSWCFVSSIAAAEWRFRRATPRSCANDPLPPTCPSSNSCAGRKQRRKGPAARSEAEKTVMNNYLKKRCLCIWIVQSLNWSLNHLYNCFGARDNLGSTQTLWVDLIFSNALWFYKRLLATCNLNKNSTSFPEYAAWCVAFNHHHTFWKLPTYHVHHLGSRSKAGPLAFEKFDLQLETLIMILIQMESYGCFQK